MEDYGKGKNTITIDGGYFKDAYGRVLMLRGVNLGGSSKVPSRPNGATWLKDGFYDHRQVSFVGRPFPIEEAEEQFSRLRSWGFTFLRFLVTWEAIEHAGPGLYDREYLDFVRILLEKAAGFGIQVFIDPHQDVWSRFSGGDGAPGWTFELIGMDIRKFQETGAAFTHQEHGDPLPQMIWSTNATKLAAATMFTLFFGGTDFAPLTKIDGISIQEYLQHHYIKAIYQLADRLKDLPNIVGFDTLNEPLPGWIGIKDLTKRYTTVEKGFIPTPFQAMQLGAGIPLNLERWERGVLRPKVVAREVVNPAGKRVWLDGFDPIWQKNGIWKMINGKPVLLQPNHFGYHMGRTVDFNRDYYVPFNNRFATEIRKIQPKTVIFVEKVFNNPGPDWTEDDACDVVYAPHWYDPVVLVMKKFHSWLNYDRGKNKLIIGAQRIKRSFIDQLSRPLRHARQRMGGIPVVIGEVGIAYDLDAGEAYRTGNFSAQEMAWERIMVALEANLHHFTLWNYTADNTNARGDNWNDEDLSIFSRDQQRDPADINSGGRALRPVVRPYPMATAGIPGELSFNAGSKEFIYSFKHAQDLRVPTIIYFPSLHYQDGFKVDISDGEYKIDLERQMLFYYHGDARKRHWICVVPEERSAS